MATKKALYGQIWGKIKGGAIAALMRKMQGGDFFEIDSNPQIMQYLHIENV